MNVVNETLRWEFWLSSVSLLDVISFNQKASLAMEAAESGDELTSTFLHTDPQNFLVQEEMEDLELTADNTDDSNQDQDIKNPLVLREQDRFLPIANVAKIMKKAIPETGKIAKDARECVQECVSEFISFITSEASDRCHMEKRKTINGEDILFAMTTLGFDNYVEPLKLYLLKYREATKGVKSLTGGEMFEDSTDEVFSAQEWGSTGVSQKLIDSSRAGETLIYAFPEQHNSSM